jgi:hypothetical protein
LSVKQGKIFRAPETREIARNQVGTLSQPFTDKGTTPHVKRVGKSGEKDDERVRSEVSCLNIVNVRETREEGAVKRTGHWLLF